MRNFLVAESKNYRYLILFRHWGNYCVYIVTKIYIKIKYQDCGIV